MAAHTYRETGHAWHLPFIKPLAARRNYPEWYRYVVLHSDTWSQEPEDGLMSTESLRAWAAILPDFWAWCARNMRHVIDGVDQPLYRFPPGLPEIIYIHSTKERSFNRFLIVRRAVVAGPCPSQVYKPVMGTAATAVPSGWRPSTPPQEQSRSRSQTRPAEPERLSTTTKS